MCPEYLDFFDDPGPSGTASFFTNFLFDAAYFENELPRTRAFKAAPVASGLRSLLCSLLENPDPAQLGFDVEPGKPVSWLGAPKAKTRIAFLATHALDKDSAAFLNRMSDAHADWGMITDGRVWRLHSGAVFAPADRFLEIRLPELLDRGRDADLKFFSLFFTPAGFGPSAAGELKNITAGHTPPNPRAHESFLADPNDAAHPLHIEWAFPDLWPSPASNTIFETILIASIKNISLPINTRKFINKRLNSKAGAHGANSCIKALKPLHSRIAVITSKEIKVLAPDT